MRQIKAEKGWKRVEFRLIAPGVDRRWHYIAPAKELYTEKSLETMLWVASDELAKQFPQWELRLVQIGPNRFNFVYDRDVLMQTATSSGTGASAAPIANEASE
jgi:hypothetical protein